jgi:steroid 5-alpha reductase family enzyme
VLAPRWSRRASFAWWAGGYVAALAAAGTTLFFVPDDFDSFWAAAVADLAATLVIFAFSRGLKCSSMYDAYWSVAPIVIVFYWVFHTEEAINPIRAGAVLFLVTWWGIRLTYNWARSWPGLHHTDWRYVIMRDKAPRLWFFSDLFGIHLFPTVQVLFALSGAWVALTQGHKPLSWVDLIALLVTAGAITIETVADQQLVAFAKVKRTGEIIKTGLWAYSRHPNYFGELSFWWGLYLFGLAADPGYVWTIAGPLMMTGMFLGVSIPWMDRRSCERRTEYAEHMKRVSSLVPWFPKKA